MYQLDEKLMSDNRAIIAISKDKTTIEPQLKPGMLNYAHVTQDLYTVTGEGTYKRILQENADGKIYGDICFADNITIDKNLIVKGEATELITKELVIEDNMITLNKGEEGTSVSEGESGLCIDRGLASHAYVLFKEQSDRLHTQRFTWGIGEDTFATLYSDGDLKLKKDLIASRGYFNGDITTTGNLTIDKDALVKANLSVNGRATIDKSLTVKESASVANNLTVNGSTEINALKINGNLLAAGEENTFTGNVDTMGSHYVKFDLTVGNNASIANNLSVNGITNLEQTSITLLEADSIDANLLTAEDVKVNNSLAIKKDLSVEGVTTMQNLNAKTTTVTELTVNGRTIINDHAITDTLQVKGDMVAGANCSVEDDFVVYGATTLEDVLVNNILNVNNNINTKEQVTARELTTSENIEAGGDLFVRGSMHIQEGVTIGSNLRVGSLNVDTTLDVGSNQTIGDSLTVNRDVVANTLTARTKMNTPELTANTFYLSEGKNVKLQETNEVGFNDNAVNINNATLTLNNSGLLIKQNTTDSVHVLTDKVRVGIPLQVKSGSSWGTVLDSKTGHKSLHAAGGADAILPSDIRAIENAGNVPSIQSGIDAEKPAAGKIGRLYVAIDDSRIYRDNGVEWIAVSSTDWDSIKDIPDTFTPPIATQTKLGGVIVGEGLEVSPTGILNVKAPERDIIINRQEYISQENQTVFTLDTPYELGTNSVSVYVFGQYLPPSAFIERTETTIELRESLPGGEHVEVITTLIPKKSGIVFVKEEMFATASQTEFTLKQGYYEVGANALRVYVYGCLLPPSAIEELTENTFKVKETLQDGALITVEYINHIIHNETLKIEQAKSYPQRLVHAQHENARSWTVVHGLKKYPDFIIVGDKGVKLTPKTVQYITLNRAILTFEEPLVGKVYCQ